MPANGKRLFRAVARLKADAHRVSLPQGRGAGRVRGSILGDAVIRKWLFQHRLATADLRNYCKSFLSIIGHAAVGDIVAVPTGRGIDDIELRKIDRRNVPRQPVDQQPASPLPLPVQAGSSGRLSFTRKARRTTNSRSVTSCGIPSAYSLTRPSMTSARTFMSAVCRLVPNLQTMAPRSISRTR